MMTQHGETASGTSKGYVEEGDTEGEDSAIWDSYKSGRIVTLV